MTKSLLESEISRGLPINRTSTVGIPSTVKALRNHRLSSIDFIKYGSFKLPIKLMHHNSKSKIQFPTELATKLGIMPQMKLGLKVQPKSKALALGPLFAVMVSRYRTKNADRPFANSTTFCKEMSEACQQLGAQVFFFTPQDIANSSSSSLQGHLFYQGSWQSKKFPIPLVIYNRLTSRKYENYPHVKQFLQKAKKQHAVQIFNERYLNKSEVFRALRKEKSMQSYLPESHVLSYPSQLQHMIAKYNLLFLKPITGSLGKGVMKIRKVNSQHFECHTTQNEGTRKQSFRSLQALQTAIWKKTKKQNHQIQQGIELITINQRPVDFRALVQKNEHGKWAITSVVARIAGPNHFVSNVARGGTMSTVRSALSRTNLKNKISLIVSKLRHATLAIAQGIENQIPSHFGELGVDLGVDKHGKIWLIEVNSKPSKDDQTPLQNQNKARPSVKNAIKYMFYLSRF